MLLAVEVRSVRPWHEFEIGGQPVGGRDLAVRRIAIPEPAEVGIVGGDQDVLGAEPRAGLEKRRECGDLGFRPERDHLEVSHGDAGRIQPGERLLQARFVFHQRIGNAAWHGGSNRNPTC